MKKLFVFSLFAILFTSCLNRIDAGYEGIKVRHYGSNRGVDNIPIVTGAVWYNPFTTSVYEFPLYVQTVDYPAFSVNSSDGGEFVVDPTISIRVQQGFTPLIFKKYRKDLRDITRVELFNHVRNAFRINFNSFTTDSIVSNRENFERKVEKDLIEILDKEGIVLEQMTSGLKYSETITRSIDNKIKATQEAIQAENEVRAVKAQAEKLLVSARAEAEANKLRQQNLTPELIQIEFIKKWDGKTPLYGNSPVLLKNL
jgi:regulator of protease activity HflC (stomatin/prohibitin superfamily)